MKYLLSLLVCTVLCFAAGAASAQSISDIDLDTFLKEHGAADAKTHTDPFSGGAVSAGDLSVEELQLTGIVYKNESNAYALISGYLVRPGDKIAGYKIDLIEKDKVKLRRVDDVFLLYLGGGI